MEKTLIRLGHSPDPDDAFMFYGLAHGQVDPGPFRFEHILRDIQTLNDWAREGRLEVTAISVHAYPYVQQRYALLNCGASMGATELARYVPDDHELWLGHPAQDYGPLLPKTNPPTGVHGPLLVAAQPFSLEELKGKLIAIPGTLTSAYLALQMALGPVEHLVMMFDEIPTAVKLGKVDAGLLIHEGQLTYRSLGLHLLLDLGKWWFEATRLPLPLGGNVIRRDLGPEKMAQVSRILRASIDYSLAHRAEAVRYALQFGRGLDTRLADQFVGLYVNAWTLNFGPAGRAAVREFLARGQAQGLVPPVTDWQFI